MKANFLKKLLVLATGMFMTTAVWADDIVVPTPVYLQDFEEASTTQGEAGSNFGITGATLTGAGAIKTGDPLFGKYYKNAEGVGSQSNRANYLTLTTTAFSGMTSPEATTISFWLNANGSWGNHWGSMFVAYESTGNAAHGYPFSFDTRACLAVHSSLYETYFDNNGDQINDWRTDGADYASSWHHVALVYSLDKSDAADKKVVIKQYIDGTLKQTYNLGNGNTDHKDISMFDHFEQLTEYVIGGNSPVWDDPDNNYAYDEIAIYNVALTADQISQIRTNKLNRTVTGTQIGLKSNGSGYVADGAMTGKVTLKPGESYHYNFKNYNRGINNWNNYVVPVWDESDTRVITVRADNWEDMHHVGESWGSSAGCTSNFNWTNFSGNMNGATIDMTVTFTTEKKFNMSANITTVDGSSWTYSYTNDYTGSSIDLSGNSYIKVALAVSHSWLDLLFDDYSVVAKTMSDAGWATYCSSHALNLAGASANLTDAYIITGGADGKVTTTSVKGGTVPAGTGLLLKGTEGTITIPIANSGSTDVSANKLVGVFANTDKDQNTIYVLMNDATNGIGFYKNSNAIPFTVGAYTAYLPANFDGGSGARAFYSLFDDVTAIEAVTPATVENGMFFDLQGRRIAKPTKGIYIVNGKKVAIK